MTSRREPGYDRVSDETRAFARTDERVVSGAGRGPTPTEAAAAEAAPPVNDRTREAYREMIWRGATHRGGGRLP